METFKATHIISSKDRAIPVCNVDGALYTSEEWEAGLSADWSLVDGVLLFQGSVRDSYSIKRVASFAAIGDDGFREVVWGGLIRWPVRLRHAPPKENS